MPSSFLQKMFFVMAGMLLTASVAAQTMYRCGSVYQDQPCQGSQQGKAIGSTGAQQSSYRPVADSECAQRGADTLKIVWGREAGASAEKQKSDINIRRSLRSPDPYKLINDVYNKRGSAPEVRAAIEADCMLEKERLAQAAALLAAAGMPIGGGVQGNGAAPPATDDAQAKAANVRRPEEKLAQEAATKKARCADLKSRSDAIRDGQRTGGSAVVMDRLRQKLGDTENQMRDAGCL